MIIDAQDTIIGRLATFAAKQALLGETITIINAEKAVVSGEKQEVLARWRNKYLRGTPSTGPFVLRSPERLVRRIVRGMIPYKTPRGSEAYKRVKCYVGVPQEFAGKETIQIAEAHKKKLPNNKSVTILEISKNLGGAARL